MGFILCYANKWTLYIYMRWMKLKMKLKMKMQDEDELKAEVEAYREKMEEMQGHL